jgi:hypothetical protein
MKIFESFNENQLNELNEIDFENQIHLDDLREFEFYTKNGKDLKRVKEMYWDNVNKIYQLASKINWDEYIRMIAYISYISKYMKIK